MLRYSRWVSLATTLVCASASVAAFAADRHVGLHATAERVGRFERLELEIELPYVVDARDVDPYDPSDVEVAVEIATPSGRRLTVPAFCMQRFEDRRLEAKRPREWFYPVGSLACRARFAPAEVGTHTAVAKLRDRTGSAVSKAVTFECVPSQRKGFLRTSERDRRFFALSTGESFFAIGQNVCYIRSVDEQIAKLEKLAAHGVNFVRLWVCCEDWALGVESRKSAWGRSWAWNPPIVRRPGRGGYHSDEHCVRLDGAKGASLALNPCHPIALRPDAKYALTGSARTDAEAAVEVVVGSGPIGDSIASARKWRSWRHEIDTQSDQRWAPTIRFRLANAGTAWIGDLSLREVADDGKSAGPELLWEADVDRSPRGDYDQLDSYRLDRIVEAAERLDVRLQLCLLTRDHYMQALRRRDSRAYRDAVADAKKLLRYAVARWGYSTHVAAWEYFNEMDPGLPNEVFYAECGEYLERIDPYRHLRTTSAWHPCPKDWGHAKIDVANEHFYMRPASGELLRDAAAAVLDRAALLRRTATSKPALIAEFGVLTNDWRPLAEFKRDAEYLHLHNALWASMLSGLSGTVMHWFWDDIHRGEHFRRYRPVAAFAARIPWATAKLRPTAIAASVGAERAADGGGDVDAGHERLRVVALAGEGCAYAWIQDRRSTWWNRCVQSEKLADVEGAVIVVEGLAPGAYDVEWRDTRTDEITHRGTLTARSRATRIDVPAFSGDIAVAIVRQGA